MYIYNEGLLCKTEKVTECVPVSEHWVKPKMHNDVKMQMCRMWNNQDQI